MPADGKPGAWLAAEFASGACRVLESMTGEAPTVEYDSHEISAADLAAGEEALLWWEQPLSLADAFVWVGARQPAWHGIGGRVLRLAGVEEVDAESSRGTYLEIVTQTLSGIAAAVSSRIGREISCGPGKEAAPASIEDAACFSFRIVFPDSEVQIVAAFHHSLCTLAPEPVAPADPPALEPQKPSTPPAPAAPPNSIDLLLDVELPVSISFGRAQFPLKDVIKLTTGSIVELNRSVSEPVEVIVNNCVIARGEVVVVEGNFGIRIKQVISRQERLRTLN